MGTFVIKRLVLAVLVLATVSLISFSLLQLAGDLAQAIAGESATAADVEAARVAHGLDRPFLVRYADWLMAALHGDLGLSYFSKEPVVAMIVQRLPITATLGLSAIVVALSVAIPLGIVAALHPNSWIDRASLTLAVVGQAMPSFWLALQLIVIFGLQLRWLPISGTGSWQHFVMPTMVLAFNAVPAIMRLTRAGMIEVMASDYIRTARAKGLSGTMIVWRHALRNSIIPVISLAAVQLGFSLGGSIIVEAVFALHGVGYLAWISISRSDFPVVQGIVLMFSLIYVGLTLLADLLNAKLDPPDPADMTTEPGTDIQAVNFPEFVAEPSSPQRFAHHALRHPGLLVGSTVLILFLLMALFAPLIAPYDPYAQDLTKRLVDPVWHAGGTWEHPLGTDHLGRDYLSRMIYGVRISLVIGAATAVISGLIGTTFGLIAGYFGGKVDSAVMFLITNRLSMPVILIALSAVALVKGSLTVVILILGFLLWDRFAVVVRAATMQIRGLDYVTAAECLGCSRIHIIAREILPNIIPQIIVVATLEMAHAILLEAALSFLGLGVQPPMPSWGLMVAEGRNEMLFSPWITAIPGFGLLILVLAINLVGDGVRDVLAPERRT